MYIEIDKQFFDEHIKPAFPEDSSIVEQGTNSIRYGSRSFNLNTSLLSFEEIEGLYQLAKEVGNRSYMVQLSPIRNLIVDAENTKVTSLKSLPNGIIQLMKKNLIDGWLYHLDRNQVIHPFLVRKINYVENGRTNDRPFVMIELVANSYRGEKGLYQVPIHIDSDDIQKRTVREILASKGYHIESQELKDMYQEHIRLFEMYQPEYNKQFYIEGYMYEDSYRYGTCVHSAKAKAVNDEETVNRQFTSQADANYWREVGIETGFEEIPFHTFVRMFHLDLHKQMWVHVADMTPYEYNTDLRDKLILPQTHRDLIDILVNDMDILQEDIIEGKSGGTTILCVGKAGLGKTLSAEVYSEVVERPLYKVHSGQLGLTADKVEKNLEDILKRASRWGAVLLIDEADVYIRSRGNDIHHNSVVASFLRTLEYFNGLLFMTTNRGDDVDDAIVSRCIAVIKYETPSMENARKIWRVLADQFQVQLSDDLIEQLVDKFPEASGRDIKELLKLSSRFAKGKNIPLTLDVFRQCSQFRGLVMKESGVNIH